MATTARPRAASGSRSCRRSPPLKRPPTMATTPDSKLSIERLAASTLVALESFTNRTPPLEATGSITCSRPRNPRSALVMADGEGGDHVAEHATPGQLDDGHRHQALERRRGATADPFAVSDIAVAGPARR